MKYERLCKICVNRKNPGYVCLNTVVHPVHCLVIQQINKNKINNKNGKKKKSPRSDFSKKNKQKKQKG